MNSPKSFIDDEGYHCIVFKGSVLRRVTHEQRTIEFMIWDDMRTAVREGDIERVKEVRKMSIEWVENNPVVLGYKMLQRHLNNALQEAIDHHKDDITSYLKSEGATLEPFDISCIKVIS